MSYKLFGIHKVGPVSWLWLIFRFSLDLFGTYFILPHAFFHIVYKLWLSDQSQSSIYKSLFHKIEWVYFAEVACLIKQKAIESTLYTYKSWLLKATFEINFQRKLSMSPMKFMFTIKNASTARHMLVSGKNKSYQWFFLKLTTALCFLLVTVSVHSTDFVMHSQPCF